jgi:hypothetical protein
MVCQLGCYGLLGRSPDFIVWCLDSPEAIKPGHQFVPLFNTSANWCCHCGYFLSPGQGNSEGANRRCEKCGLTCHAQCQAFLELKCDETILNETYKADEG